MLRQKVLRGLGAVALRERVYAGRSDAFGSLDELAVAAKEAWRQLPMEPIKKAIGHFRERLNLVATCNGGPIQHIAR